MPTRLVRTATPWATIAAFWIVPLLVGGGRCGALGPELASARSERAKRCRLSALQAVPSLRTRSTLGTDPSPACWLPVKPAGRPQKR